MSLKCWKSEFCVYSEQTNRVWGLTEFSVPQTAIANASTLAEVERLKGLLQAGQIPGRERKPGHHLLLLLLFSSTIHLSSLLPDALCDLCRELGGKSVSLSSLGHIPGSV